MSSKTFLTAAQVRKRYGSLSNMALHRWLNNPDMSFPRPIRMGDGRSARRLWDEDQLVQWERARAAQSAA